MLLTMEPLGERCDACGAEALFKVCSGLTTNILFFCGHHYQKLQGSLALQQFYVSGRKVAEPA